MLELRVGSFNNATFNFKTLNLELFPCLLPLPTEDYLIPILTSTFSDFDSDCLIGRLVRIIRNTPQGLIIVATLYGVIFPLLGEPVPLFCGRELKECKKSISKL